MIHTATLIAFAALFLHSTTKEGMIFYRVRELTYRWPAWIKKPVYDCPICMAPWFGAILYAVGILPRPATAEALGLAALTCLAAGGVNAALIYFIGWAEDREPADADGN